MKIVPTINNPNSLFKLNAVASASSFIGTTPPSQAIDNNTSTLWVSSAEANPWLQIDIGGLVDVYRVEILFTSSVAGSAYLLSSDSPTDQAYGTFQGPPDGKNYSGAFDQIAVFTPTASNWTILTFNGKSARFWRIQQIASLMSASIAEVNIFADSDRSRATSSRVRIGYQTFPGTNIVSGGTSFSDDFVDLLDLEVNQSVDRQIWGGTVILNNKLQKYSRSSFPEGTPIKIWLEGTSSLLGIIANVNPKFREEGFTLELDCRGNDEYLNQGIRAAWASIPISDQTTGPYSTALSLLSAGGVGYHDIISTGPFSILGQTLNSSGTRVIGNLNTQNANIGPNIVLYKAAKPPTTKLQILTELATQCLDGGWIPQNTGFPATLTTYGTSLGRATGGKADGYWFTQQTQGSYAVDLRDPAGGATIWARGVIPSAGAPLSALVLSKTNPIGTYDGNVANDPYYNFVEMFQPVFLTVSACSTSTSFGYTAVATANFDASTGGAKVYANQIDTIIIEATDKLGRTKRLHYLLTVGLECPSSATCSDFFGNAFIFPPNNTVTDVYVNLTGATWNSQSSAFVGGISSGLGVHTQNLYNDYVAGFGSNGVNDTIVAIRVRQLPFQQPSTAQGKQVSQQIQYTDVHITPAAHVKTPPQPFDFYVHESSTGSQVSDLFWFARPRPGIDTGYRHLDDIHSLKWYKDSISGFTSAESNNLKSFDFMKGDTFRVKNDITLTGGQDVTVQDGATIPADSPDYLNRLYSKSTHGSKQQQVSVADMASITSIGRRPLFEDTSISDFSSLVRQGIKDINVTRVVDNRGVVEVRGNANLQPGNVVRVHSDWTELDGFYYIVTVRHKWNHQGFFTTLTLGDDRFRMVNDFARTQANLMNLTNRGLESAPGAGDKITFTKTNADIGGQKFASPMDSGGVSLPLNAVPEFSHVKYVRFQVTKYLGPENRGSPDFASSATFFPSYAPSLAQPDVAFTAGWNAMGAPNNSATAASNGEMLVNDTQYGAIRFFTTQSAGRLMFSFLARLPSAGYSVGNFPTNAVLASIWTDTRNTNGQPVPGKPLSVQNDVSYPTPSWFAQSAPFLIPGVSRSAVNVTVSGWVQVPFANIFQAGPDSATNPGFGRAFGVEIGLDNPLPPNSFYWVVLRTASMGANFYITGNFPGSGQQNNSFLQSPTAGDTATSWATWAFGGAINQSLPTKFTAHGQNSLSSSGSYIIKGSLQGVPLSNIGASSVTSGTIQSSNVPTPISVGALTGFSTGAGSAFGNLGKSWGTLFPSPSPGTSLVANGNVEGVANGLYVIEPVTGDHYPLLSYPGQHQTMSFCEFPTSIVMRRDRYGDVFQLIQLRQGASANPGDAPTNFARLDYTLSVDAQKF